MNFLLLLSVAAASLNPHKVGLDMLRFSTQSNPKVKEFTTIFHGLEKFDQSVLADLNIFFQEKLAGLSSIEQKLKNLPANPLEESEQSLLDMFTISEANVSDIIKRFNALYDVITASINDNSVESLKTVFDTYQSLLVDRFSMVATIKLPTLVEFKSFTQLYTFYTEKVKPSQNYDKDTRYYTLFRIFNWIADISKNYELTIDQTLRNLDDLYSVGIITISSVGHHAYERQSILDNFNIVHGQFKSTIAEEMMDILNGKAKVALNASEFGLLDALKHNFAALKKQTYYIPLHEFAVKESAGLIWKATDRSSFIKLAAELDGLYSKNRKTNRVQAANIIGQMVNFLRYSVPPTESQLDFIYELESKFVNLLKLSKPFKHIGLQNWLKLSTAKRTQFSEKVIAKLDSMITSLKNSDVLFNNDKSPYTLAFLFHMMKVRALLKDNNLSDDQRNDKINRLSDDHRFIRLRV